MCSAGSMTAIRATACCAWIRATLYPTYGDDSTIEDRTPTSGNLFLRVERDNNFLQWGRFRRAAR